MNIDYQKKLLGYHSSFDSNNFFRELDQNNKGYLTAEDFQAYLGENEDFAGFNFENLVRHISLNGGNRVTFIEFQEAITPYGQRGGRTGSYGGYRPSFDTYGRNRKS